MSNHSEKYLASDKTITIDHESEFRYFELLPKSLRDALNDANYKYTAIEIFVKYILNGEKATLNELRKHQEMSKKLYDEAMANGFR